ncbi:glucokinase [Ketogulonicigenium vulgare]|uniref:Glucokinase, putative n=1 Tax=Ketogulonicigenium vulgare (strain WSH-001) TaxID=759362 RepID=F9Y798_KETVW|nr:glucokinase [Ketogulonicigenium vulgare]ADO42840.1 glucokinase [Ketogulonicigenium vulgare Y25]AEM41026.1 Glucokinase, putative [Ketogulonicigenium vulgare WSH-001]ALJ81176.1 glucokinase [Ketogulonicigenium vulgare]ANW33920.1 glucokinase [Ketogulonicigenium vulgare]AOZ54753.1 glucokinase [Ketogulonicigenium vulgare]
MTTELSLVADIGGTNTRLALSAAGVVLHDTVRRFQNEGRQLNDILDEYLAECCPDTKPHSACFALAGPISGDTGRMTNLAWTIHAPEIATRTSANRCILINDLQAQGYALPALAPDQLTPVLSAERDIRAPRLVVGLGTGYNAAFVLPIESGVLVPAAEAGHASLPAHTADGRKVVDWLLANLGQAQVEDALSGTGFAHIHAALHGEKATPPALLARCEDGEAKALKTLEVAIELLGGVVGDLALIFLPRGGIYLTGGFGQALTPWLRQPHLQTVFHDAFAAKGKISAIMQDFALSVIGDDFAALEGCALRVAQN